MHFSHTFLKKASGKGRYALNMYIYKMRILKKLDFFTMGLQKVGIMNCGCFEIGLFGIWVSGTG
jgi:hypothetical protein